MGQIKVSGIRRAFTGSHFGRVGAGGLDSLGGGPPQHCFADLGGHEIRGLSGRIAAAFKSVPGR